jgi:ribosomal protein L29
MEMSDLKKKDIESLAVLAAELRETMRDVRFGAAGSRARDVKQVKTVRRDIARIETELSARLPERERSQSGKLAPEAK